MTKFLFSILAVSSPLLAGDVSSVPAVPEPSTYLMMAAGVSVLAIARYRKSKKK